MSKITALNSQEKSAIEDILNEAENKYASLRTPRTPLSHISSPTEEIDDSFAGGNPTPKYSAIKKPASSTKKPYSQMIIEQNPNLFEHHSLELNNNKSYSDSDNEPDIYDEHDDIPDNFDKKSTKSKASKKDISSIILEKARKSDLLQSFHENSEISTNSSNRPKKTQKSSNKVPSLYARSIKKATDSNIEISIMYDRYDLAKLRQDNIDYKNQIARLKNAIDKATMENQKLREELSNSERISSKQKAQIQFLLTNAK